MKHILLGSLAMGIVSARLPAVSPRAAGACSNASYTFANSTCTSTCQEDMAGGDYAAVNVNSFDDCASACGNDPLCLTAQYNEGNSYCYLKNSLNNFASSTNTDSVKCTSNACGTTKHSQQSFGYRTCTPSCLQDRPGGDYSSAHTGSFDACMDLCASDSNCQTAQFNHGNGYCYLKNSVNALVSSSNTDTVDCTTLACDPTEYNGYTAQCGTYCQVFALGAIPNVPDQHNCIDQCREDYGQPGTITYRPDIQYCVCGAYTEDSTSGGSLDICMTPA